MRRWNVGWLPLYGAICLLAACGPEVAKFDKVSRGAGMSTCGVFLDGTAGCWGPGLGVATTASRNVPLENLVEVAVGRGHACALRSDGAVYCWGSNFLGQLGNGTTSDSDTPGRVEGLRAGATAIAAGSFTTCAALDDGSLSCWGDNYAGGLGSGTTDPSSTPVTVLGLSGVTAVALGLTVDVYNQESHTCAIANGGAWCWGGNSYGQLGDGSFTPSLTPVPVSGLDSGVRVITVGPNRTCAVVGERAKCWGDTYGPLPQDVAGLALPVLDIHTADRSTCFLLNDTTVRCVGSNFDGQLGAGMAFPGGDGFSSSPLQVVTHNSEALADEALTDVVELGGGAAHHCALLATREAWCWGSNYGGALGIGSEAVFSDTATPVLFDSAR